MRPAVFEAEHLYVAEWTSGLNLSPGNSGKYRLPFERISLASGMVVMGLESPTRNHSIRGVGNPSAVQSTRPPVELEKTTSEPGSSVNLGLSLIHI